MRTLTKLVITAGIGIAATIGLPAHAMADTQADVSVTAHVALPPEVSPLVPSPSNVIWDS